MSSLELDELTVRVREFRRTIRRAAEMFHGLTMAVGDYDPDAHGSLITFAGVPGYREVERYWVNAPFAFVTIYYDLDANEHLYYVVEPELDEFEADLLDRLFSDLRESLIYRREMGDNTAEGVLCNELRDRELVLQYLRKNDVTDYRRFTAMVNEYYADPDRVVETVERNTDIEVSEFD
jgi:archaeal flagellar protein FlaI